MSAGCGFKCAKATLFGLNFLFWVAALAVLVAGVWMRMSPDFLQQHGVAKLESDAISLSSGGLVMIGVAAVAVTLGFFGCCGTAKESRCMLGIYIIVLFIIIFVQVIAAACLTFAITLFRDAFHEKVLKSMGEALKTNYGTKDTVTNMWDITQVKANCCGVHGPLDYMNSTWYRTRTDTNQTNTVPRSCCVSDEDEKPMDLRKCQAEAYDLFTDPAHPTPPPQPDGQLNVKGCYTVVQDAMRQYSMVLIGTSCGVAVLELLCFILGVFLCCNVGKYTYDYE